MPIYLFPSFKIHQYLIFAYNWTFYIYIYSTHMCNNFEQATFYNHIILNSSKLKIKLAARVYEIHPHEQMLNAIRVSVE